VALFSLMDDRYFRKTSALSCAKILAMNIEKPSSNIKFVVVMSLILLIIFLYVYGARQQLENININMDSNDQSAYMEYSQKMVESNYTFIGGRNRMPVYPFI
jgi:hypothetical protein